MGPQIVRRTLLVLVGSMFTSGRAFSQTVRIVGSGASFPFPLYSTWFHKYSQITRGVSIDYQSKGSGGGVRDFISRIVDFAASDAAMTDAEIAQVDGGVVLLPMTAGQVVLVFNLPNVRQVRLPRDVYPLIFTGEVDRWNDPRIVKANPGVTLPDTRITVVRRSDSAGTTYVFTKHLSAISESFRTKIGVGTTVQWPNLPNFIGAPRNDGITATVAQTPGAIGYVEFGFAMLSDTPFALLENKSGKFVEADEAAGQAALASADFSGEDLRIWVEDPASPEAYPIATFTWMLFYRKHGNERIAAELRKFVAWAMDEGQGMAAELGYVPLPAGLIKRVKADAAKIQ